MHSFMSLTAKNTMRLSQTFLIILGLVYQGIAFAEDDCQATPEVLSATSLSGLADFWFGSPEYRFAIMTATNARSNDPMFAFISNPHELKSSASGKPNHVCIPEIAEAVRLKLRFDNYLQAVHDMTLAEPGEVVNTLDPVPSSGPATVVSWVRSDQTAAFPGAGSTYIPSSNMWVTLAPHLKEFCQGFARQNSQNPERTILRLEQRLGLAPASSKTHFVELAITEPRNGKSLFRPCGDPSVITTSCNVGGPQQCSSSQGANCDALSEFFYQQYYSSYGSETPTGFPWTSLGYTFDWAFKEVSLGGSFDFVQVGESEYVVTTGAVLKVLSVQTTEQYCELEK
jgi:hypothetical protein